MANLTQTVSDVIVSLDGLAVAHMREPGLLSLRLSPSSNMTGPLRDILGHELPDAPNSLVEGNEVRIGRLGPDEWLLFCNPSELPSIEARLNDALKGSHYALVDITGNRACFHVAGSRAQELLAIGCSLDLTHHGIPPNSCVQTILAKAQVVIVKSGDGTDFEIYPRRSFAAYLGKWLRVAGEEFRA